MPPSVTPPIRVGIIGLGNVGTGTLTILHDNARQIREKLGFDLEVGAICSRSLASRPPAIAGNFSSVFRTTNWQEVVSRPDIHIVAELVGGTTVAAEIVCAAIRHGKSVVTAN